MSIVGAARRCFIDTGTIHIMGAGSIGMALAVHLTNAGRPVLAVRTSAADFDAQSAEITIDGSQGRVFKAHVPMRSLAKLDRLTGSLVITAKSYANPHIAARLRALDVRSPIIILQNGVGVEDPYLALEQPNVYRCVLYATGQPHGERRYTFATVTASPIGIVRGTPEELEHLVARLHTDEFPFRSQPDIRPEVWKKATINAVFNTICTLLEVDNGIFLRDESTVRLAREVIGECLAVMHGLGVQLTPDEILEQLFAISRRSDGQLISTLQDINHGRETEIDSLNLAIARIGESLTPPVKANTTRMLGEMVKIKSVLGRKNGLYSKV